MNSPKMDPNGLCGVPLLYIGLHGLDLKTFARRFPFLSCRGWKNPKAGYASTLESPQPTKKCQIGGKTHKECPKNFIVVHGQNVKKHFKILLPSEVQPEERLTVSQSVSGSGKHSFRQLDSQSGKQVDRQKHTAWVLF